MGLRLDGLDSVIAAVKRNAMVRRIVGDQT